MPRVPNVPEGRLKRVADMISLCIPPHDIQDALSAEYHVSQRTIRNYIRKVFDRWAGISTEMAAEYKNRARTAMERFYGNALKDKDYSAAIRALDYLAKLDGCYAPTGVVVSGTVGHAVDLRGAFGFTPDEARERILRGTKKHAAGALAAVSVVPAVAVAVGGNGAGGNGCGQGH